MAKREPITSKKRTAAPKKRKTIRKTIKVKKKSAVIFSARGPLFPFQNWIDSAANFLSESVEKFSKNLKKRSEKLTAGTAKVRAKIKKQLKKVRTEQKKFAKKKKALSKAFSKQLRQLKKILPKSLRKSKKSKKSVAKKPIVPQTPVATSQPKTRSKFALVAAAFLKPFAPIGTFIKTEVFGPFIYIFRYHLFLTVLCLAVSAGILYGAYEAYDIVFKDLPSVSGLTDRQQHLTTKILDRNGKLLYSIYKDENRTLVPLAQIPQNMIHATIAIEDRNFYSHRGISVRGIFRALLSNAQSDNLQGGSTITQQLVKNTLLSPERTLKRKVREIVLSFMVEGSYSKNEILEMYFNQVGYGGSTYGVEEASQKYFGKSVRELSLAECAFLAGLPAAPSAYSPFGATPEYAYVRQHEVLQRMVEDGYITKAQAEDAKNQKLQFNQDSTNIRAPHFVMYVKSILEQQYGQDLVNQGGLEVRTTLDLDTQDQAQKIVTDEVNKLAPLRISNGAAMVTNPNTGEILAMIGSKDYFDFAHDGQVNVTTRPRQPGSSIKPLTYSLALEKGQTPASTILDEPTTFITAGSPPYSPKNYDGKFHGLVTLRTALASSFNIPAVKTLASVGIDNMIDKGQQMGITTWGDRSRFGLSLTLGSGEVLMVDMAQLYGTFANYGDTVTLNPILSVKNYKGDVLYENSCAASKTNCPKQRTIDPKVAYEITDILSDNVARSPAFGPNSVLYIPNQQVAVKTGTTNNLKDNWAIGYTPNRLVAVWVGNNDGTPMSYVASGITGASPIWNKIMRTQLSDATPSAFPTPDGFVKIKVCSVTETLPCQGCPSVVDEVFAPGTEPTQACSPAQFAPPPSPSPQATPAPTAPPTPVPTAPPAPQPVQNRNRILNGVSTGR